MGLGDLIVYCFNGLDGFWASSKIYFAFNNVCHGAIVSVIDYTLPWISRSKCIQHLISVLDQDLFAKVISCKGFV